jgi:pimeloyl-ACP methyl ester carboxylesterase
MSVTETVILLHGLGRTARSLDRMRRALRDTGWRAVALDHPSTRADLTQLARGLAPRIAEIAEETSGRVHFVGHSLGGLLARAVIADHRPARLGRLVMLGPPNRGSAIADRLSRIGLYRRLLGPAGQALGTDTVPRFPDPDYEIGVVAGTRSIDPAGWLMLPRPNDGRVSVAATRIPGLADHATMPVTHALMMNHPAVIAATARFLKTGRFHGNS